MSKQDRQGWRTPAQFDQRHNFEKSFAEAMGIATDARTTAEAALKAAADLDANLDHEEIFNRLTDNGTEEAVYEKGGHIYINASYIQSGTMLADLIKAGVLQSKDGKSFYLDLDNGILKGIFSELSISGKTVEQITNETMSDFRDQTTKDIENLQSQIDGNITSWFYNYVPTANNEPASLWTTEELKNQHLGDLFYVVENDTDGGKTYRWVLINGTYKWTLLEDSEVTKALAAAEKAQDTADGKRRVFVAKPETPYDEGDLWAQGENGDLLVCKTSRSTGDCILEDWVLASDYINTKKAEEIADQIAKLKLAEYADTVQGSIDDLQSQLDGNVTTWFYDYEPTTSNEPASGWSAEEKEHHLGDLFYIIDDPACVGMVYRWTKINGVYGWELYGDSKVVDALEAASKAKDAADGKRRVFIDTPRPPYDEGDLWAQGNNGDLKVCKVKRSSGSYIESDWKLATNYINSESAGSIAQDKVDAQTQEFIFNKLTNNGEKQGVFMKDNQIYINAEYINFDELNGKNITMTGIFTCTTSAYLEPGKPEYDYLQGYILGEHDIDDEDAYDFNRDGVADFSDLNIIAKIMRGEDSVVNYMADEFPRSTVTMTINLKDPAKAIKFSGYNIWGRLVESYVGINYTSIANPETERHLSEINSKINSMNEVFTEVHNIVFSGVSATVRLCKKGNVTEMSLFSMLNGNAEPDRGVFYTPSIHGDFWPDRSPLDMNQQPIHNVPPSAPLIGVSENQEVCTVGFVTLEKDADYNMLPLKITYDFNTYQPLEGWTIGASMTWIN